MSDWQPIESAPKDGTWVLVVLEEFVPGVARWHSNGWQASEDGKSYSEREWPVTHWMPLPPPPTE